VAPFAPFISEELWQNLKRRIDPQAPRSVHLSRWPEADRVLLSQTEQLRAEMEVALKAVSLGRAARQDQNLKTRQPLQAALLQVPSAAARRAIERFRAEVCEELNVEELSFAEEGAELVRYTLRPNLPKLGKKLGKRVKLIQDALAHCPLKKSSKLRSRYSRATSDRDGDAEGRSSCSRMKSCCRRSLPRDLRRAPRTGWSSASPPRLLPSCATEALPASSSAPSVSCAKRPAAKSPIG
jgi:isoleucyl-tRNA synthetase